MKKLLVIGKFYRTTESLCYIVIFCILFYSRFDNVFFLPLRLKSGALYVSIMPWPVVYSLIQLIICGWGMCLVIRDKLWSGNSCNSRWIIRSLLLVLLMMPILYEHSNIISSLDETVTNKYFSFVEDLFGISGG